MSDQTNARHADGDFDVSDIFSLPSPQKRVEKRTFHACGRKWNITVSADGMSNPEAFYRLSRIVHNPEPTGKHTVVWPGNEPFVLTDDFYIKMLRLLAEVTVHPVALSGPGALDKWAIFGQRIGSAAMDRIIDFALEVNGLTAKQIQEALSNVGEAASTEAMAEEA